MRGTGTAALAAAVAIAAAAGFGGGESGGERAARADGGAAAAADLKYDFEGALWGYASPVVLNREQTEVAGFVAFWQVARGTVGGVDVGGASAAVAAVSARGRELGNFTGRIYLGENKDAAVRSALERAIRAELGSLVTQWSPAETLAIETRRGPNLGREAKEGGPVTMSASAGRKGESKARVTLMFQEVLNDDGKAVALESPAVPFSKGAFAAKQLSVVVYDPNAKLDWSVPPDDKNAFYGPFVYRH